MINQLYRIIVGNHSEQSTIFIQNLEKENIKIVAVVVTNQSSDILQHSQNRPTGDRWLKF